MVCALACVKIQSVFFVLQGWRGSRWIWSARRWWWPATWRRWRCCRASPRSSSPSSGCHHNHANVRAGRSPLRYAATIDHFLRQPTLYFPGFLLILACSFLQNLCVLRSQRIIIEWHMTRTMNFAENDANIDHKQGVSFGRAHRFQDAKAGSWCQHLLWGSVFFQVYKSPI